MATRPELARIVAQKVIEAHMAVQLLLQDTEQRPTRNPDLDDDLHWLESHSTDLFNHVRMMNQSVGWDWPLDVTYETDGPNDGTDPLSMKRWHEARVA